MPWVSFRLRGDRVWVRTTPSGEIAADASGRVDTLYKRGGKVYRAMVRNLEADAQREEWPEDDAVGERAESGKKTAGERAAAAVPGDALIVYADGACTGNPGPAGLGIVILDGSARQEISEYLGPGTNNIAELTAIIRALEIAPRERTVVIHSDSAYALGLLGKGWKAKANQELVERMRSLGREFRDLRLVKVEGHAGIVENERADALAREAVSTRRSRSTRPKKSS